jgi:hypothetical protein
LVRSIFSALASTRRVSRVDFLGVGFAECAAEDAEVVGEHEHRPAVHLAPAGDHAVGVGLAVLQPEPGRPVPPERLHLMKGALIQQQRDPLPRRQLAPGVLPVVAAGSDVDSLAPRVPLWPRKSHWPQAGLGRQVWMPSLRPPVGQ